MIFKIKNIYEKLCAFIIIQKFCLLRKCTAFNIVKPIITAIFALTKGLILE